MTLDFWPEQAGVLQFYPGWAKAHEILLGFPRDDAERAALLAHFRTPLRLCPTPATYLASEAVDPFIEPDWERWPLFECVLGDSYATLAATPWLMYGEIDHGDHRIEGDRFWNGYHAPEREWLIHYQRTGDERYFRLARPMARHRMDVDVLHWPPEEAGNCHQEYNRNHWTPGGQIKAWVEGLAEYALMTGDRRAREVIAECGTWLARHPSFTNERTSSLPVLALSHCHRVVNDPAYLEAAKPMVDHLHQVVMADGHIRTPFMVGHLVDALHWYWKRTGDEKAREAAVRAARWMHTVCVGPTGMPYYTDREDYPKESQYWRNVVYTWAVGEVATPSARAYFLSGDHELLRYTGYVLDSWLHYYWGGGGGAYHGCPLAVYAMNSASLTEADLARIPPNLSPDEVAQKVLAYIAQPPEGDSAVPGLIPELGRFLLDAGQAPRGLEVYTELAASHPDAVQSLATVCDHVEARLAGAAGQTDRAEAALLRFIGRYPQADPKDVLSPGHFRVAAAYWQLAALCAAAGRAEKAVDYRARAQSYVGTHFKE